jgi:hypothetical protein
MHFAARLVLQAAVLVGLLLVDAVQHRAWSADAQAVEYQIKATVLCKFGNFVEWPAPAAAAGAAAPFGIGIVGPEAVIDEVTSAARGQTVNGRPIVVRRLGRGEALDGLGVVFVARSHDARLAETLAEAKGRPILTVTESEQGAAVGSMINFVVVSDKVKFDIALPPAELSGVKISSRLLAVARQVTGRLPS